MLDESNAVEGGSGTNMRLGRNPPSRSEQIAWAAGLFEGEGTMSASPRGKRGSGAQLRLGMTDFDVVERFQKVIGYGGLYVHNTKKEGHRACLTWYVYEAAKVEEVLNLFIPWFGARRRAKALEVLAVAQSIGLSKGKRTHCPKGHPYDEGNLILEPIKRDGREYLARRCKICRTEQARDRARRKLGITEDRYRK